MITKKFTHQLPDQPYKQAATQNKTVECTYHGPQFLLVRMLEQTGVCLNVERYNDDKDALEATIVDDGPVFDFFVLDAEAHPWEAAYLSNNYSHGEVTDYEETLPTGEKYVYAYKDGQGIIGDCHAINELKYDKNLKVFTKPKFVTHPINPVDFLTTIENQKKEFDRIVAGDLSKYSNETIAEIRSYHKFLIDAPTKYAGIDHWKIQFPKYPNFG